MYKDDNGKDYVLTCVRKAEEHILKDMKLNHGYLPYNGLRTLLASAQCSYRR